MNMPWTNRHGAAKVVVICVAVLLVSAGLCGVQLLVLNLGRGGSNVLGSIFIVLGAIELIAIVLSALVGVIAMLILGFRALFRRNSEP